MLFEKQSAFIHKVHRLLKIATPFLRIRIVPSSHFLLALSRSLTLLLGPCGLYYCWAQMEDIEAPESSTPCDSPFRSAIPFLRFSRCWTKKSPITRGQQINEKRWSEMTTEKITINVSARAHEKIISFFRKTQHFKASCARYLENRWCWIRRFRMPQLYDVVNATRGQ